VPWLLDGQSLHAGTADSMHVPDRRVGTIPMDDHRENRQEDRAMVEARRPRKPSVEQIVQIVVSVINALARLLETIHHVH
jgi:hypothetical protein